MKLDVNKYLTVFLFLTILMSCRQNQTSKVDYGYAYNDTREKVGLIPLPKDWESLPKKDSIIWWHPKDLDSLKNAYSATYYGGKVLRLRNDSLLREADVFVVKVDSNNKYLIYYSYSFAPDETTPVGWMYFIIKDTNEVNQRGETFCAIDYVSKNKADSILSRWNLKH